MFKNILFGEPLENEIALFNRIERQKLSQLSANDVTTISAQQGIKLATAYLYEALKYKHSGFIEQVDALSAQPVASHSAIKIIVIPGMFYREYPELGADGSLIKEIGQSFGMEIKVIPVHSTGLIKDNLEIIQKELAQDFHPNIWLVSLSKGSSAIRHYLQSQDIENVPKNIRGWISISGITDGTRICDVEFSNPIKKLGYKLACLLLGFKYSSFDEIRSGHEYWQQPFNPPVTWIIIHVVGVPLLSHMQRNLIAKYKILSRWGPNDGLNLLGESLNYPGFVYPVWGVDHYLRTSNMSSLLHKICHYIAIHTTKGETL